MTWTPEDEARAREYADAKFVIGGERFILDALRGALDALDEARRERDAACQELDARTTIDREFPLVMRCRGLVRNYLALGEERDRLAQRVAELKALMPLGMPHLIVERTRMAEREQAALARVAELERAVTLAALPLEAIGLSVRWELTEEIKSAVLMAIGACRSVLAADKGVPRADGQ